jgi:hypothetical protein
LKYREWNKSTQIWPIDSTYDTFSGLRVSYMEYPQNAPELGPQISAYSCPIAKWRHKKQGSNQ